jgi:hypothetical protein
VLHITEGSKSNIPCCALLLRQVRETFAWYTQQANQTGSANDVITSEIISNLCHIWEPCWNATTTLFWLCVWIMMTSFGLYFATLHASAIHASWRHYDINYTILNEYDAHRTRSLRVTFAWHPRRIHAECAHHIRESVANVSRTCRKNPSVINRTTVTSIIIHELLFYIVGSIPSKASTPY